MKGPEHRKREIDQNESANGADSNASNIDQNKSANGTDSNASNNTTLRSSSTISSSSSSSSSTSMATSLALGRGRRRSAQATKCPVCFKTFYRARMALVDINDHINRCSDAQFQVEKSAIPKVQRERKKLKLDTKGNVIMKGKESGDTARAESLKVLKSGARKEAFEHLLLKHLDF